MPHAMRSLGGAAVAFSLGMVAQESLAATVGEVIYSTIPGSPTAQIPGLPGHEFRTLGTPYASGDFTHWVFRGQDEESSNRDVVVMTAGATAQLIAKAGQAIPGMAGFTFGTVDNEIDVNNSGNVAMGFLAAGASGNTKTIGRYDGSNMNVVAQQGGASTQIPGATYAGGANLADTQITTDGRVGFRVSALVGVPAGTEQAIILGNDVLARKGMTIPTNQSGGQMTPYGGINAQQGFNSRYTQVNASGSNWVTGAKVNRLDMSGTNNVFVLVNNNAVQLEEDQQLPGAPAGQILAELNCYPNIAANGDALVRCFSPGAQPFTVDQNYFYINSTLAAKRGDAVPGGVSGEHFQATLDNTGQVFASAAGNSLGDVIYTAGTDNADHNHNQVLELRDPSGSSIVVMREGDGVDLDGNGSVDAYINAFGSPSIDSVYFAPTSFLSDDMRALLKVELRTEADPSGAATVLGQAYIQVQVPEPGTGALLMCTLALPATRRRRRRSLWL